MVLPVQKEVYRNEVVVMSRRFHVEDEAVDAVLNEGPQEPAHHEQDRKRMLRDRYGEICKSRQAAMKILLVRHEQHHTVLPPTWGELYPCVALSQGGVALPTKIEDNRKPDYWDPVPVATNQKESYLDCTVFIYSLLGFWFNYFPPHQHLFGPLSERKNTSSPNNMF